MKTTCLKTVGGAVLAILMLAVLVQLRVSAQNKGNEEESNTQTQEDLSTWRKNTRKLEGVWNVQVTRLNCQTGAALGTFPSMMTFIRGGVMNEFGSQGPPSMRGSGFGVWNYESRGEYASAFQFFRFNADGTLAGRQIVRQQIELSDDGNSYTSSATAQVLDVNGNVIANNCSSGVATRFE